LSSSSASLSSSSASTPSRGRTAAEPAASTPSHP
jgi:hypothetical protein